VARQREEQLRLEAGAGALRVEVREKRVLGFVQDDRRVETGAEAIGQQRFSEAGRPLDRDVTELQG
jgi:hypothetical protein